MRCGACVGARVCACRAVARVGASSCLGVVRWHRVVVVVRVVVVAWRVVCGAVCRVVECRPYGRVVVRVVVCESVRVVVVPERERVCVVCRRVVVVCESVRACARCLYVSHLTRERAPHIERERESESESECAGE